MRSRSGTWSVEKLIIRVPVLVMDSANVQPSSSRVLRPQPSQAVNHRHAVWHRPASICAGFRQNAFRQKMGLGWNRVRFGLRNGGKRTNQQSQENASDYALLNDTHTIPLHEAILAHSLMRARLTAVVRCAPPDEDMPSTNALLQLASAELNGRKALALNLC